MKRNSHKNFRKNRIKSVHNINIGHEKDIYKNKLDQLLKEKSAIEKEISNISNSLNISSVLNQSPKRNNNFLKFAIPKPKKKKSFENNLLPNHLINENNHLHHPFKMGGLIHKSSNNLMASSSTKENLNLSKINFNFNLNKSSFGGKKKKSTNHVLFQRGSKNHCYDNISKNTKERKSTGYYKNFESRNSLNRLLNLGQNFILTRRRKQIDKNTISSKQSIESSKLNFLDLYDKDKIKIININQNIQNELDSKELKKKVKKMRKVIIQNSIIEFQKQYGIKDLIENKSSIKKEQSEKFESKAIEEDSSSNQKYQTSDYKLIEEENKIEKIKNKERFRFIKRSKELYDSYDDEEVEEEAGVDYYISPSNYFIKIFDLIVFMASMIYFVYVPFLLSKNIIISNETNNIMLMIIDVIYIFDIILNFFRAYQNFDENLVRNRKYIFEHYLNSWFFIDFIQCIPFFTLFKYFDNLHMKDENKFVNSLGNNYNKVNRLLYLIIMVKIIKLYKMLNDNITIFKIWENISQNEIIDNYGNFFLSLFYSFSAVNLCACIFIFIGKNSHPGWLVKINMQDEPYKDLYITSVYYILVTVTTVGYGDITGSSYPDIIYQMFLLIIGTIAYSFIISYFSNYIVKINQKSITFQKNVSILEEIRLHHPDLKDNIYQEILKNLRIEQLYEKNDKNILFDSLPITLKNKLIMEMYKDFINNFVFFRDNHHSDFIVKVITSLKPLLTFKDDILIQEGDYVKEIFFVKSGVLVLNINIDQDNLEESINKYLDIDERGKINISYISKKIIGECSPDNDINLYEKVTTYFMNRRKKEINNNKKNLNLLEIKIIEVHKNEHFGDALMFLNEKSPLSLKVRSKVSELLVLRKMEAIEIYSIYPNIWDRINKKSIFNMEQIKKRIKKELYLVSKQNRLKYEEMLEKTKTIKKYLSIIYPQFKFYKSKSDKKKIKNKEKNEKEKNEKEKNDEEYSPKEKESKNNIKSNNKSNVEKEENCENNNNNDNNKKVLNKQTSINSNLKSKSKEKKSNSSDISDASNEKVKEKNKEKSNELISNDFNSNIDKLKFQKSSNRHKKSNKDNKKTNLSIKLKIEEVIDNSNRGENENSSTSEYENKSKISDIKKEKEKFVLNSFSNLSKTNEKSIQINSIYENLNNISNNIYASNPRLQSKIKNALIKESALILHKVKKQLSKEEILSNFSVKSFKNFIDNDEDKKTANSFDKSKLKSFRSNKNHEIKLASCKTKKEEEVNSEKFPFKKFNSLSKFQNGKSNKKNANITPKKTKYYKSPRKKGIENFGMSKKLNIINQNIQGANKNINNPEEFYADFFNNIIRKNTQDIIKKDKFNNKFDDSNKGTNNAMKEIKSKKSQVK